MTCEGCGRPLSRGKRGPRRRWCSDACRYTHNREAIKAKVTAWKRANPEKVRLYDAHYRTRHGSGPYRQERRLWASHGWRPADWHRQYAKQGGRCWICRQPIPYDISLVAIDHDHGHCPPGKSCPACRRGLCCDACNMGIGLLGDDPATLRRAAAGITAVRRALDPPLVLFGDDAELPRQLALFGGQR